MQARMLSFQLNVLGMALILAPMAALTSSQFNWPKQALISRVGREPLSQPPHIGLTPPNKQPHPEPLGVGPPAPQPGGSPPAPIQQDMAQDRMISPSRRRPPVVRKGLPPHLRRKQPPPQAEEKLFLNIIRGRRRPQRPNQGYGPPRPHHNKHRPRPVFKKSRPKLRPRPHHKPQNPHKRPEPSYGPPLHYSRPANPSGYEAPRPKELPPTRYHSSGPARPNHLDNHNGPPGPSGDFGASGLSQSGYGSPQAPVQDGYGSPLAPSSGYGSGGGSGDEYGSPQAPAQGFGFSSPTSSTADGYGFGSTQSNSVDGYGSPRAPSYSDYGSPHSSGQQPSYKPPSPSIDEEDSHGPSSSTLKDGQGFPIPDFNEYAPPAEPVFDFSNNDAEDFSHGSNSEDEGSDESETPAFGFPKFPSSTFLDFQPGFTPDFHFDIPKLNVGYGSSGTQEAEQEQPFPATDESYDSRPPASYQSTPSPPPSAVPHQIDEYEPPEPPIPSDTYSAVPYDGNLEEEEDDHSFQPGFEPDFQDNEVEEPNVPVYLPPSKPVVSQPSYVPENIEPNRPESSSYFRQPSTSNIPTYSVPVESQEDDDVDFYSGSREPPSRPSTPSQPPPATYIKYSSPSNEEPENDQYSPEPSSIGQYSPEESSNGEYSPDFNEQFNPKPSSSSQYSPGVSSSGQYNLEESSNDEYNSGVSSNDQYNPKPSSNDRPQPISNSQYNPEESSNEQYSPVPSPNAQYTPGTSSNIKPVSGYETRPEEKPEPLPYTSSGFDSAPSINQYQDTKDDFFENQFDEADFPPQEDEGQLTYQPPRPNPPKQQRPPDGPTKYLETIYYEPASPASAPNPTEFSSPSYSSTLEDSKNNIPEPKPTPSKVYYKPIENSIEEERLPSSPDKNENTFSSYYKNNRSKPSKPATATQAPPRASLFGNSFFDFEFPSYSQEIGNSKFVSDDSDSSHGHVGESSTENPRYQPGQPQSEEEEEEEEEEDAYGIPQAFVKQGSPNDYPHQFDPSPIFASDDSHLYEDPTSGPSNAPFYTESSQGPQNAPFRPSPTYQDSYGSPKAPEKPSLSSNGPTYNQPQEEDIRDEDSYGSPRAPSRRPHSLPFKSEHYPSQPPQSEIRDDDLETYGSPPGSIPSAPPSSSYSPTYPSHPASASPQSSFDPTPYANPKAPTRPQYQGQPDHQEGIIFKYDEPTKPGPSEAAFNYEPQEESFNFHFNPEEVGDLEPYEQEEDDDDEDEQYFPPQAELQPRPSSQNFPEGPQEQGTVIIPYDPYTGDESDFPPRYLAPSDESADKPGQASPTSYRPKPSPTPRYRFEEIEAVPSSAQPSTKSRQRYNSDSQTQGPTRPYKSRQKIVQKERVPLPIEDDFDTFQAPPQTGSSSGNDFQESTKAKSPIFSSQFASPVEAEFRQNPEGPESEGFYFKDVSGSPSPMIRKPLVQSDKNEGDDYQPWPSVSSPGNNDIETSYEPASDPPQLRTVEQSSQTFRSEKPSNPHQFRSVERPPQKARPDSAPQPKSTRPTPTEGRVSTSPRRARPNPHYPSSYPAVPEVGPTLEPSAPDSSSYSGLRGGPGPSPFPSRTKSRVNPEETAKDQPQTGDKPSESFVSRRESPKASNVGENRAEALEPKPEVERSFETEEEGDTEGNGFVPSQFHFGMDTPDIWEMFNSEWGRKL